MDIDETVAQARSRYERAAHAMQSGVAYLLTHDNERTGTPKDLRVGLNSAMVDNGALATLLIDKGVFTAEEYATAMADAMEREVELHKDMIFEKTGVRVNLA